MAGIPETMKIFKIGLSIFNMCITKASLCLKYSFSKREWDNMWPIGLVNGGADG